ncbi:MAG TPA: alpha/beta hydrolase [Allosphingosinicella sp.]|nr:alpha/beta hydrolase [Allosphingosinicella sp.]
MKASAATYAKVSTEVVPERSGRLVQSRMLDMEGMPWRYSVAGEGPALLLLTGALGRADFGSVLRERLVEHFRVIAPDYPAVAHMEEMLAGLEAILAAEGVARAHVLGGSFGGVVAQAFSRARGSRIASLLLSHTGGPRHAPGAGLMIRLLALMPEPMLRGMFRSRLRPAVAIGGPGVVAAFEAAVARLTKADLLSRVQIAAEFNRTGAGLEQSGAADFPVLILESADDPLIRKQDQAALAALYPRAELRRFEGSGHLTALLQTDQFAGAVIDFIRRAEPTSSGTGERR